MIDSNLEAIQSRWTEDGFNFVEWRDPPPGSIGRPSFIQSMKSFI